MNAMKTCIVSIGDYRCSCLRCGKEFESEMWTDVRQTAVIVRTAAGLGIS